MLSGVFMPSLHLDHLRLHLHNLPASQILRLSSSSASFPFCLISSPNTLESPPSTCRSARGQSQTPTAAPVARRWTTSMSTRPSRDNAPAQAPVPMPMRGPSVRGRHQSATAMSYPSRMSPTSREGSRPAPPVGSKRYGPKPCLIIFFPLN